MKYLSSNGLGLTSGSLFKPKKKYLFPFLVVTLMFILVSCTNGEEVLTDTNQSTATSGTLTTTSALTHDWGVINIRGGKVSKTFTLTNNGEGPVMFSTATTSCMCTTADITLSDGSRSPQFGMHGNTSWNKSIQPGEKADVTVTFDPMAHGPNGTGKISRKVYVISNASPDGTIVQENPQIKDGFVTTISVLGDVLSEEDYNVHNEL